MINKRIIIAQKNHNFHFSQHDKYEFKKYFREVVYHYLIDDPELKEIKKDDILFVYAHIGFYEKAAAENKFGILYPGFGFHPFKNPEQAKQVEPRFDQYKAIFMNEGPIWETYKHKSNAILAPLSCDPNVFKKTRKRNTFKRMVHIAGQTGSFKGRHISKEVFNLLPYECEQVPAEGEPMYIPYDRIPGILQNADGFLFPSIIGDPPHYPIDAKYNVSFTEAGMCGLIMFWHDALGTGNTMETVFEIPIDPIGIAEKVKEVINNIDLDRHSILTAQEFYDKCNMYDAIKFKVDIIKRFL